MVTGEVMWIATRTRPDISYIVGAMSIHLQAGGAPAQVSQRIPRGGAGVQGPSGGA